MTFWHDRPCECAYEISNDMGSPSSPDLKSPSHRALSLVHCGTKYSGRFVLPVGRQYRPGIQFKLHVGVATPGGSVSCFPSSNDPDRPLLLCKSYYTETLTGTGQFLRRFGIRSYIVHSYRNVSRIYVLDFPWLLEHSLFSHSRRLDLQLNTSGVEAAYCMVGEQPKYVLLPMQRY